MRRRRATDPPLVANAKPAGESIRIINAAITDDQRRRREARRRVEELEEALRRKREDEALREGDW